MLEQELAIAQRDLEKNGWLDIEVDPTLDLVAEINRLKKEKRHHPGALLPGIGDSGHRRLHR